MLIGISGQAGSGKDTCADFLVEEKDFAKVALADPLKRICRDVFDFSTQQLWGPSQFRNEPDERIIKSVGDEGTEYLTPRYALQQLGTEWGRDCNNNVWVDYAIRLANKVNKSPKGYIYDNKFGLVKKSKILSIFRKRYGGVAISDVRFKNEIDAIQKAGGKVIRVVREGAGLDGAASMHRSEAEMREMPDSLFDEVIVNDGSLDDLKRKVLNLVELYR